MYQSEELLKKVNEALDGLAYDRQPYSLYEPIKYVLAIGGKRVRPVLMLLAYNLYKDDPERIITQAVGLETYHNFTLLHDDLMDNADMRRGHETVHKRWNPNQAILSGDTMLLQAFERIEDCEVDKVKDVFATFLVTTYEVGEGQQLDVEFETRDVPSWQVLLKRIRRISISSVNRSVWLSSFRMTCWMCMETRRCSERTSAVTSLRIRRPICLSMR